MQASPKGVIAVAVVVGLAVVGYSVKAGHIFIEGVSAPPLAGAYKVETGQNFELKGDGTFVLSLDDGFRNGTWVQIDDTHVGLKNQGSTGTGSVCAFSFVGYSTLLLSECSLEATFTRI